MVTTILPQIELKASRRRLPKEKADKIAAIFRAKYPALAAQLNGRIERAVTLCVNFDVRLTDNPQVFWVKSESNKNPHAGYVVSLADKSCTCPDSGKGNLCKHRLAVAFHVYGGDWIDENFKADQKSAARANFEAFKLKQYQHLFELRAAEKDAWQDANVAINTYVDAANRLLPDGTYPDCDDLRAKMLMATDHADYFSRKVQEHIRHMDKHLAEFLARVEIAETQDA